MAKKPELAPLIDASNKNANKIVRELRKERTVSFSDDTKQYLQEQAFSKIPDPSASVEESKHAASWTAIRTGCERMSFERYEDYLQSVFCPPRGKAPFQAGGHSKLEQQIKTQPEHPKGTAMPYFGIEAYKKLKTATEAFLIWNCGVRADGPDDGRVDWKTEDAAEFLKQYMGNNPEALPYLKDVWEALKISDAEGSPFCKETKIIGNRLTCPPLLELIWSYWHEIGGLTQAVDVIAMRFQNRRNPAQRDPLAQFKLAPLRPLSNLLFGYIADEPNRLTVERRAYEYDHEYGLRLTGQSTPTLNSVDSRSAFVGAFHNLLGIVSRFYKEMDDRWVTADAWPVLNAIKDVHLTLAEGAHNQFGDLPRAARAEMLMQMWLLGRDEVQQFLGRSPMVPYSGEPWMPHLDTMRELQGWRGGSVRHFHTLAKDGEKILLSIRYHNWSDVDEESQAQDWATYWRPEIRSYIHAYKAYQAAMNARPQVARRNGSRSRVQLEIAR